jgi:hypothetical protein
MKLSKNMKQLLIDELNFIIKKMKESEAAQEKMYFFSAAHGMVNRIMNLEFNNELAFLHFVLSGAHSTINARIAAIISGDAVVQIPQVLFDKLEESLEEIVSLLGKNKATYPALEKIALITYCTTGNGYYNFIKGSIEV